MPAHENVSKVVIIFLLLLLFFFLKGKYTTSLTIFVTAEHHRAHLRHDAATVWLENASARSFKICIRELQNFAGVHDDISVVSS